MGINNTLSEMTPNINIGVIFYIKINIDKIFIRLYNACIMKICNQYEQLVENENFKELNVCDRTTDYTGFCFLDTNIPTVENSKKAHLIVIISKPINNKSMAVVICSVKPFKGFEYDKSCLLNVGDIRNNKGDDILKKISYVRYDSTIELDVSKIPEMKKKKILKFRGKVSKNILYKIIVGGKISQELKPYFYKYLITLLKDIKVSKVKEKLSSKRKMLLKHLQQNPQRYYNFQKHR